MLVTSTAYSLKPEIGTPPVIITAYQPRVILAESAVVCKLVILNGATGFPGKDWE
jgi:hypothetical protein